jgi:Concanavalin A-like lectin/glucanases superfamily/Domain of unknown function (DUF1929)/Bacterial Ig domain
MHHHHVYRDDPALEALIPSASNSKRSAGVDDGTCYRSTRHLSAVDEELQTGRSVLPRRHGPMATIFSMMPDRRVSAVIVAGCLTLFATPRAYAQTGLVAAYSFNEGTGTAAADASGNAHTGSVSGATWTTAGKYGGALSFDGVNDWVTIADTNLLDLTTGMTVEAWIRPSLVTNWRTVVLKERSGGLSYALYSSDMNARPSAWIRRSSDISTTATSTLAANTWVHLAMTYDGARLRLYINGVQASSRAVTGAITTSTSPLRLGGNAIWDEFFGGLIDDVRIYNRALTGAELQTDMVTPVAGTPTSTWTLSGSIAPATAGNGALVTLGGAASATTTADPTGAFSFSGLANGSYVVSPSKSGYAFTPSSQNVTINGANVSGVTFSGSATGNPGIQFVQKAVNGAESSVSSISTTFSLPNTAGNFLIVTGTAARPAGSLTISDSQGNTYLPVMGPADDPAQQVSAYIWYVPNCRGGTNTITLTPTFARALEIHASEWSGIATTNPVDQTAWAAGAGTFASSGARTTTANGELVFGYTFIQNTATEGAGFTPLSLVNGDLDEYLIQPVAGSIEATFTQSAGDWLVLMATFRPLVIGGSDTTPPSVALTAPAAGASVTGTIAVSASASDNVGVAGVQFKLDGANLGAEVTVAPYTVNWDTTSVADGSHSLTAAARDAAGNVATSVPVTVTVANTTSPAVVGQWGASFDVGMVAVNMVLMHTGKVLMFSGDFTYQWTERTWDPATGQITLVPNPYYNLFCAGHSQLADGRILVVGGYDTSSLGAANANIFDPVTQTWSALPNMAYRRWYPTSTTLPDGRALITSGAQTCLTCFADVPEIFDPATNRFTTMPTARLSVPYYPFMYVLPDGRVLDAGATEDAVETRVLDVNTGQWAIVDPIIHDGHTSAMYRPGKILKSGTAADSGTVGAAAETAYVLDMTQPNPTWRQVASMAFPRAFHNSTILPTGDVLITGGGTRLDGYDVNRAVFEAELWSPATETWRTLARAALPRLYHSTALLLPDGRVLIAGSGNDGPAINQLRAELYSPPYLFKGARPSITSAPGLIQYGASFTVQTPNAANITSVALIRPGAVTHSFDEDQRFLNLTFTAGAGMLTIQAPANGNLAPPGYYMLFLLNSNGVPSVASFVRLPAPSGDSVPPTAPTDLWAAGGIGTASLTWTGSTDDVAFSHYNVHRSIASGFVPSTANRIGQSATATFSESGLSPATYFYVVTAQDVAGNISAPSNEASVAVSSDTMPPAVAITAPADLSTVSGTVTVTATATDNVGVSGVQFRLDGTNLGAEDVSPPYSVSWNTTTATNGTHVLTAVARDAAGNQQVSAQTTVTVSNAAQTPPGLVAAYGFNEGTGTQVNDASGTGNNGTISGATWTSSGRFGSALSFNGTSNWVTVGDAPTLDLTTAFTLEAWVYPSSLAGWRTVILKEATNTLAYALYSGNGSSRPAGWAQVGGADYFVNGTANTVANTWTHLACTYDGTTLRLFVNGNQVATATGPSALAVSAGVLRIGGNAVWGEYFSGRIDEVRVYNRALSASEIQADMNSGVQ